MNAVHPLVLHAHPLDASWDHLINEHFTIRPTDALFVSPALDEIEQLTKHSEVSLDAAHVQMRVCVVGKAGKDHNIRILGVVV